MSRREGVTINHHVRRSLFGIVFGMPIPRNLRRVPVMVETGDSP